METPSASGAQAEMAPTSGPAAADSAADAVADVAAVPIDVETLFRDTYPAMVRLAYLVTGSREAAEDAVQTVFVRLQRKRRSPRNHEQYLRRAVVNECKGWHRRKARERAYRPDPTPHASLGARELSDVLSTLSPHQRAAVVLKFYEDSSLDDIGDSLGCSKSSAATHLRRGLENLGKVLEQ